MFESDILKMSLHSFYVVGMLWPCITFQSHNDKTIKTNIHYHYYHFELLQGATIFPKLDLKNAYHFACIEERDDYRTETF